MMKRFLKITGIGALLISFIIISCTMPDNGSKTGDQDSGASPVDMTRNMAGDTNKAPIYSYPYGGKGFTGSKALEEWQYLVSEYEDWKKHYVTSSGAPSGALRVKRDWVTYDDTVSEGQAYGMLLAVYFDDEPTFKGLLMYTLEHLTNKGLMHWRVSANGVDICEFGEPVYRDRVVEVSQQSAYTGETLIHPRSMMSATDADLDMAAALIFAYKRWGNVQFWYSNTAVVMLHAIAEHEVIEDNDNMKYIRAGSGFSGSWGRRYLWNPSYVTPAWFYIFEDFMQEKDPSYESGFWDDVYRDTGDELIDLNNVLGNKGLFPDWVDTRDWSDPEPAESDRGPMSYNCYYDAVRVPWRLALDYSWHGYHGWTSSILSNLKAFVQSNGGIEGIVDGYMPDSAYNFGAWDFAKADWNNSHVGRNQAPPDWTGILNARGEKIVQGGRSNSVTFVAMFATPYTALNSSWLEDVYEYVKSKKETYGNKYHYYGNTLRLLSLLYLSGNMANLYECDFGPRISGTFGPDRYLPGYYYIKNVTHGTYLTRYGGSYGLCLREGGFYFDWTQKWRFVEASSSKYAGWYKIISEWDRRIEGHLPDDELTLTGNGGQAVLWKPVDSANDGKFYIKNRVVYNGYDKWRIYADSATTVELSKNWHSGKWWQIIPAGN
jgi:endo-1,4-beta-D-glucanase Y